MKKSKGRDRFSIRHRQKKKSPFDLPSIGTKATTQDILDAIRTSRSRVRDSRR
jgi:hypothetical protein